MKSGNEPTNRDRARLIYLRSGGKKSLQHIAGEIGVSYDTVKSWKRRDHWALPPDVATGANLFAPAPETAPENAPKNKRKRGGQPGNKNALMNRGGPPMGSQNAMTTGEYARLLFSDLSEDERRLIASIPEGTVDLMRHDLALLCVREKRMLERIAAIQRDSENGMIYTEITHRNSTNTKTGSESTIDTTDTTIAPAIDRMKRVREVLLGSNVSGYYNSSAMTLSFANCVKLETLNLAGLTGAALSLDFSNNIYLKTIDTRGSALTGLRFAKNGRLTTARLNALVSLYMSGLRDLATFSMAAYTNLEVLTVENCGVINTKNVVSGASALENLRLLGISWTLDSTSLLDRIYNLGGLDDAGLPSLKAVLTGTVHVPVMRQRNLDNYNSAWPNLTVNYDTMTEQYTVHFLNADGSAIKDLQGHDYVQYVDRGSTPYDPIQAGEVQTPTKASDAQYNYTFSAWTGISDPVLANKNITAAYSTETRTYRVRWYSQAGTLLKQLTGVAYGSCVQYNDQDIYDFPELTNEEESYVYKVFLGWDKSTGFIKENTDVYAVWDRAALPTAGAVDLEDMSIAQIAGIAKNKACDTFFSAYDHTDIQVGRDYNFSNVQSQVLVATPTYFDGTSANVITTAIKLFDAI